MTVRELIEELKKYNPDMEVVDYDGSAFDELHYKRVYDSQYPHKEIEHIAVCLDFENNYIPIDIGELKDILQCQMYDYPHMYDGSIMIKEILEIPKEDDKIVPYTKWKYYGRNELDKPVFKLESWFYKKNV